MSTAYASSYILEQLDALIAQHGVNETAHRLGVSVGYMSDINQRRKAPGPKVIAALGMKKVEVYVKTS